MDEGGVPVTGEEGDQLFPAIKDSRIVWFDNTTRSIQMQNPGENQSRAMSNQTEVLPLAMTFARQVDVDHGFIVLCGVSAEKYNQNRSETDLFLIETTNATMTQITDDPALDVFPSIAGNLTVWQRIEADMSNSDIYFYQINEATPYNLLTNESSNQTYPNIGGDTIAWTDDADPLSRIDFLNVSEEPMSTLFSETQHLLEPAVSSDGQRIVWTELVQMDTFDGQVYMFDLATEEFSPVSGAYASARAPVTDTTRVVWMDSRNGDRDIYTTTLEGGEAPPVPRSAPSSQPGEPVPGPMPADPEEAIVALN